MNYEDHGAEDDLDEDGIHNKVSEERQLYLKTFAHMVRPQRVLYVKKTKGYSKASDNFLLWHAIGEALVPMKSDDASKLFHKIREKFGKELKKLKKSKPRSGAGAEAPPKSSWFLYNDVQFLEPHIQPRQTASSFKLPQKSPSSPSFAGSPCTSPVFRSSPSPVSDSCSNSCSNSAWNTDLNLSFTSPGMSEASPSGNSSHDEFIETGDSGDSAFTEGAGQSSGSSLVLRAMAASINPSKTVPPSDTTKKRKREAELAEDSVKTAATDISSLATTLKTALENSQKSKQVVPEDNFPGLSGDIKGLLGSVAVALGKVPETDQLACVIEMLGVAQRYMPKP